MKPFFKLRGVVQHYAWGGYQFLPLVLGMNNPSGKPFAEYWLGAHPIHPSLIEGEKDLFSFLGEKPLLNSEKTISKDERFPFLLKVLDVRQMLSIQVHPDKKGAIKGFEKETAKGISIQAPERNYKDRNHKPELMVALGDFYLLHGFKNEEGIRNIFQKVPELSILEQPFRISYRALYEEVMRMPQEKVDAILLPLAERILPLYKENRLSKETEDFWAAKAVTEFCKEGRFDRGIFSIYLFNLVKLVEGQGIFQTHGLPHAYLEGQNVEIMANSDNVLRAGLTEKHIDVEELLLHTKFEAVNPEIMQAEDTARKIFAPAVDEFELHHYLLNQNPSQVNASAGEIWWLEKGNLEIRSEAHTIQLKKGEALYISTPSEVHLATGAPASLFRACIPPV